MRSRVQKIAGFAYKCVSEVMKENDQVQEKYSSYAKKLPSMITHNGLLTTIAFINSKAKAKEGESSQEKESADKKAWKTIKKHIEDYLKEIEGKSTNGDLVKFFAEMELSEYRLYTKKLLFFAQWLKRIAEGELKQEESQE